LHTSPHLVKVTERIMINGKEIAEDEFIKLAESIKPVIEKAGKTNLGNPTYFEIITALAFLFFARKKVDIAVIEVGMGGRFDATNVIKPKIAVLTNVGLDHTEILGDTVEKITRDKVGIIKQGIRIVSGVKQPNVITIVTKSCRENRASLSLAGRDFKYRIKNTGVTGSTFDYIGVNSYNDLKLSLLGKHQIENASLAIRSVEELVNNEIVKLPSENIRRGLIKAYIPGRMEIISQRPLIILDGAHNGDKAKALADSVRSIFPKRKIILVLSIKKGKIIEDIIKHLVPISEEIVLTGYKTKTDLGETKSYQPEKLMQLIKKKDKIKKITVIKDPTRAINCAKTKANNSNLILVTGSLYLIGEVKKILI
jgi:dihydrofolate synthase/folylpolyglutamate synthase